MEGYIRQCHILPLWQVEKLAGAWGLVGWVELEQEEQANITALPQFKFAVPAKIAVFFFPASWLIHLLLFMSF